MKRLTCLFALVALAACSSESTAPATASSVDDTSVDLVQQYDATSAAAMDRAGIGGSELPAALALSADQKAAIQALHEAFKAANAADLAALKGIEGELKAARAAGKDRATVAAILAKAEPIRTRLAVAFERLRRDIWAVYTPEQQAWISDRGRGDNACRPDVLSLLSAAQVKAIRGLKQAFAESVKGDLEVIKAAHEAARAAGQAGATREEIRAILARAESAMQAVRAAERRLVAAILDVLTREQKANACLVRALSGR